MESPGYSLTQKCKKVLDLDKNVRFVGSVKERQVIAFIRRDDSEPLLNEEMGNLAHYQASVKDGMEEMLMAS